jgi:hypothetical protein
VAHATLLMPPVCFSSSPHFFLKLLSANLN